MGPSGLDLTRDLKDQDSLSGKGGAGLRKGSQVGKAP